MAPVTRRSQAGARPSESVSKSTQPRRVTRKQARDVSESWDMLDDQYEDQPRSRNIRRPVQQQEEESEEEDDGDDEDDQDMQLSLQGPSDINSAVNPIREIAERVGKEVDIFAENLDKYLGELAGITSYPEAYEASIALAIEYKEIAEEMVEELKHDNEHDLKSQLRQEWTDRAKLWSTTSRPQSVLAKAAPLPTTKAERVNDLRRWQEEADTWDLFRIVMEFNYSIFSDSGRAEKEERLGQLTPLHRYSTEQEIYEHFCVASDLAHWRTSIKTWLEQTAEKNGSDMEDVVQEIEKRSGAVSNGKTHGWINTREKIKNEKRMRAWPNPIDSPLPRVTRSDNTELLVTTLDPDAPARQNRTLEKPDAQVDRAMWAVTWEMLRRGRSSEEIKAWFEQRNEAWRAFSIGSVVGETSSDALFRRMCYLTSQSGCSSDYEAAVYGLLGDNQEAVNKVCHSLDDKYYFHFSSMLQRQFDRYMIKHFADRLPASLARTTFTGPAVWDAEAADNTVALFIKEGRKKNETKEDLMRPIKLLQGYLLANVNDNMIFTVGWAASELAKEVSDTEGMISNVEIEGEWAKMTSFPDEVLPERLVVKDEHALRIAVTMTIIDRKLRRHKITENEEIAEENVIAAYIQKLRAAEKYDMVPTYAATLKGNRCSKTLGLVMQDIREPEAQKEMMGLLESQGNLNTVAIVQAHMHEVLDKHPISDSPNASFRMLEPSQEEYHPAQRIKLGFLPADVGESDQKIVSSLQWFQLLRGQWKITFDALSRALRRALISGHLAGARAIVHNYPYETISERKTFDILHRSLNIMDTGEMQPETPEDARTWNVLDKQSRTYYELQQIVLAVEALAMWRQEEHIQVTKVPRPGAAPARLKKAFANVVERMLPIVSNSILRAPLNDEEATDLHTIRNTFIPELLIAYNITLCSAGHLVSREHLLDAMDLSVAIADERNHLQEVVVAACRMRELVQGFAATSKAMLVLKAKGKQWKARKGGEERHLGVWEISTG